GEILKADRDAKQRDGDRDAALAETLSIPPWVDVVVRATRVNPAGGEPAWSAAVVPVPERISFELLARHENAAMQEIAGHSAFHSKRGYIVELKPGLVGVMRTGSRQDAAFWIV